jgi:hypothetical protein
MLAASTVMLLVRLPTNNQGHIVMKNRVHSARRFVACAFFVLATVAPFVVSADGQSSLPETSTQPEGCRPEDMASWSKLYYADPDDNDVLGLFVLHRKLCELVTTGEIKEDRASDIFEAWRGRLIREREQSRKVY